MTNATSLLSLALILGGCAVEVEGWPRPPRPAGDSAAPAPDLVALDASTPSVGVDGAPDGRGCPDLLGQWSGTLSGAVTSGSTSQPVTGSITLLLKPASPGDFDIASGEMTCKVTGVPWLSTKQSLGGRVCCGVLDIAQQVDLFGVKAKGTVRCTFVDPNGCKGSWSGIAIDGSSQGSGTFELRRN